MLLEREAGRNKVKLLYQIRISLRTNRYTRKTEKNYTSLIKQFIIVNNKIHAEQLIESIL